MTMATRLGRRGLSRLIALWLIPDRPSVVAGSPQVAGDDWHGIGEVVLAELFEQIALDLTADGGERDVAHGVGERRVQDAADALEHDEHPGDHPGERNRPPHVGCRKGA